MAKIKDLNKETLTDDLFETKVPVKTEDHLLPSFNEHVNSLKKHLDTGGSFELVPKGAKAVIVFQEFNPAIQNNITALELELSKIKGIASQDDAAAANIVLKKGKQLIKTLGEERKLMTSVLDDEKKKLMNYEDTIIGALEKSVGIINTLITNFQKEELRKQQELEKKLQEQRDAELAKAQAETDRKSNIEKLIIDFENGVLKAAASATIEDIDEKISKLATVKLSSEKYMEFLPKAELMLQQSKTKLSERKAELLELEQARKTNKAAADQLEKEQQIKADTDLANLQRKGENTLSALAEEQQSEVANSQMNYELKVSQAPTVKGVQKPWVFDAETIDMALLPDEYKTFDAVKIKEAIKAGCREIAGVKIYQDVRNVSK